MPNPIKYSTGSESLALKKGNFYIGTGDVGKGPTSTTGYYDGVTPPSGGYTIYLNKATGGPSIYTASNDAQLISLTNSIAGQSYTTVNECLVYFAGQSDKLCVNRDYEGIVTDGLVFNMDVGFTPSYPKNGTTCYDTVSTNNGILTNGPTYNSADGGSIVFDGIDDAIIIPKNSIFFSNTWTWEGWINYISNSGDGTNYHGVFWAEGAYGTSPDDGGYQWLLTFRSVDSVNCYSHMRINNTTTGWAETNTNSLGYSMVNRWNHVVWQFNNGNTKLYVNNVKILDDNSRGPYGHTDSNSYNGVGGDTNRSNSRIFLGCRNDFNLESNFKMSVARHYNRVITESEILQNYNAQKGRFGL